jgi:hypothetical protein
LRSCSVCYSYCGDIEIVIRERLRIWTFDGTASEPSPVAGFVIRGVELLRPSYQRFGNVQDSVGNPKQRFVLKEGISNCFMIIIFTDACSATAFLTTAENNVNITSLVY